MTNSRSGIFILAILVSLTIGGCDFTMVRYSNPEYNFSVLLPRGWKQEEGFRDTVMQASAHEKKPRFNTNININAGNLTEIQNKLNRKISPAEFYEVNKAQLMAILPGAKYNVKENEIFAHGERGVTLSFDNEIQGLKLRFLIGVWMKGERVFIISCSGEADKFQKYAPTFQKVLQSLKIK